MQTDGQNSSLPAYNETPEFYTEFISSVFHTVQVSGHFYRSMAYMHVCVVADKLANQY